MNCDGRFAPSPTGPLHIGSFRTALAAWLAARSTGSRFLMRIEDLDRQRCRPEHEQRQLTELACLGIDWDADPVRQSERTGLYDEALAKLRRQQRIYPCFCTRAEIREAASAPHGDLPEGAYPGTCRGISVDVARRRIESGERFALRLRSGAEAITFDDRILGEITGLVDDFVLVRADGVYAYQLAVVVDDADQGVGEVVRGADLAQSTPRQILLQRLLGLPSPAYAHVPLVIGPQGARLSKRDHAATLADRSEPPARTLTTLAHSLGVARDRELVTHPGELIDGFSLDLVPRDPVLIS